MAFRFLGLPKKESVAYIEEQQESPKALNTFRALLVKHIAAYLKSDCITREGFDRAKNYLEAIHDEKVTTKKQLLDKVYTDFMNISSTGTLGTSTQLRSHLGDVLCIHYKIGEDQIRRSMSAAAVAIGMNSTASVGGVGACMLVTRVSIMQSLIAQTRNNKNKPLEVLKDHNAPEEAKVSQRKNSK